MNSSWDIFDAGSMARSFEKRTLPIVTNLAQSRRENLPHAVFKGLAERKTEAKASIRRIRMTASDTSPGNTARIKLIIRRPAER